MVRDTHPEPSGASTPASPTESLGSLVRELHHSKQTAAARLRPLYTRSRLKEASGVFLPPGSPIATRPPHCHQVYLPETLSDHGQCTLVSPLVTE